ncbi:hypothetical protein ACH5RR_018586 [Cinchona calisaya]|uniref:Uncharacterized protein n=1 Tax=Cinchona calisaya TaxID=153742 RepID=A0ABD2ZLW8_9GENT
MRMEEGDREKWRWGWERVVLSRGNRRREGREERNGVGGKETERGKNRARKGWWDEGEGEGCVFLSSTPNSKSKVIMDLAATANGYRLIIYMEVRANRDWSMVLKDGGLLQWCRRIDCSSQLGF